MKWLWLLGDIVGTILAAIGAYTVGSWLNGYWGMLP